MFAVKEKTEYKNVPISLSYLHVKQHSNLIKTRMLRRTSSESHKYKMHPTAMYPTTTVNHPSANTQMFHLEADV